MGHCAPTSLDPSLVFVLKDSLETQPSRVSILTSARNQVLVDLGQHAPIFLEVSSVAAQKELSPIQTRNPNVLKSLSVLRTMIVLEMHFVTPMIGSAFVRNQMSAVIADVSPFTNSYLYT